MSMFRLEDYDTAADQNDAEKDEIQEPSNCSCEDVSKDCCSEIEWSSEIERELEWRQAESNQIGRDFMWG